MADDDLPDLHGTEIPFGRRVSDLIDAKTTPFELAASLGERDLPMPTGDRESRSPYPLAAPVRPFRFNELSGIPVDTIVDRLEENPDEAVAFGFEDVTDTYGAGDVPDQSRLSCVKNGGRLDPDEYERIERRAEQILELCHERGHAKEKWNEVAQEAARMAAAISREVYKFITLNIVGQHFRILLVVRPVPKGVSQVRPRPRAVLASAGHRVHRGGMSGRGVPRCGRTVVAQRGRLELRGVRPEEKLKRCEQRSL